eukprot:TRINITY_DN5744_c0_g1_i1.p1 TRINITY_DN5744_c0_g1~~TRINITY_DN5744_c0_g1_i1.p1  ORF type:complete len:306 (+),score=25.09 TRINITY_DN5744_c0_g1_i1:329-1246(+)
MRGYEANVNSEGAPKDTFSKLLRFHLHDWIIFVALIITDIILNVIEPYHRYINTNLTDNLSYPFKSNTVPFWSVPVIALLIPVGVMSVVFCVRRNVRDLHHAVLGLLFTIVLTAVITDAVKDAVGRPRPDFMARCFPGVFNPKGWIFDASDGDVVCSPGASKADIKEGYKSFPSGHSSWSFAGLGYLSWYLAGKLGIYDKNGHTFKLPIVFFPLLLATLVAVSRVDDYWHHWQDVLVGGLLGLVVSTIIYHQHFPPIYSIECGTAFVVLPLRNALPLRTTDGNVRPDGWAQPLSDMEEGTVTRAP